MNDKEKINKKQVNLAPIEFTCISSIKFPEKKGFILGGTRGFVCIYYIEKN